MCCFLVRSRWRNRGGVWWLRSTGRPSWRSQWMAICLHYRRACMNSTSLWEESLSKRMALLIRCLFAHACVFSWICTKKKCFLNCCYLWHRWIRVWTAVWRSGAGLQGKTPPSKKPFGPTITCSVSARRILEHITPAQALLSSTSATVRCYLCGCYV